MVEHGVRANWHLLASEGRGPEAIDPAELPGLGEAVTLLAPTTTVEEALAGAHVFAATRNGSLLVLDAETGMLLREHRLDAPAVISPVIADGRIFVADVRRMLYCFGPVEDLSLARDSL